VLGGKGGLRIRKEARQRRRNTNRILGDSQLRNERVPNGAGYLEVRRCHASWMREGKEVRKILKKALSLSGQPLQRKRNLNA
jgi:hypothetical protein